MIARLVIALLIGSACSGGKPAETSSPAPTAPTAPPPAAAPECKTDGDCRLFSDYCTGCDCRALAKDAKDPTCSGPGVKCIADPCMTKTTACEVGKCVVHAKAP